MDTKKAAFGFFAGATLLISAILIAGALNEPVTYHGTHLAPPMPAADFTLTSAHGPVSRTDLAGKVAPMFFGYTSCPDVCPTTLLRLSRAVAQLTPSQQARVQVVFVSVDPERDTPERTSAYAEAVNPTFIGITGTPEEIAEVAAQYGIYYAKAEGSDATGYLVDHSATITVLDENGRVTLLWSPTVTADQMAEDMAAALR